MTFGQMTQEFEEKTGKEEGAIVNMIKRGLEKWNQFGKYKAACG